MSPSNWTAEGIRKSIAASLRRLQVNVIDVVQFHGGWFPPDHTDAMLNGGGLEAFLRLKEEGQVRIIGFATEGPTGGAEQLVATGAFDTMQVRYNLTCQHPSDYDTSEGIMCQAGAQGMGIILMRPMSSGIFQKLMARAFLEVDTMKVGRLLLNYVLSDPHVDIALVGLRDPRFVEINSAISDDVSSRIDLAQGYGRDIR